MYTIVPTYSSLVAANPVVSSGATTYTITGAAGWNLYTNGAIQSNGYCEVYLGSTQLTVSQSSNDFSITIPNNTTSSTLFVQVL